MKKGIILMMAFCMATNSAFAQSDVSLSSLLDVIVGESKAEAELTIGELIALNEKKQKEVADLQTVIDQQKGSRNGILLTAATSMLAISLLRANIWKKSVNEIDMVKKASLEKLLKRVNTVEVPFNSAAFAGTVGYTLGSEVIIQLTEEEIEELNEELVEVQAKLIQEQDALMRTN